MQQEMAAIMGGSAGATHWAQEDDRGSGPGHLGRRPTLRPGMTMTRTDRVRGDDKDRAD